MRGTWGKMEIDELTEETLAYIKKGSLGDRMKAHQQFKDDPTVDKDLLDRLFQMVRKEYSAKFMRGIAEIQMFNESL
jgi:glycogen synthase